MMLATSICGTPPILWRSIWCVCRVAKVVRRGDAPAGVPSATSLATLSSTRLAAVMLWEAFSASSSDRLPRSWRQSSIASWRKIQAEATLRRASALISTAPISISVVRGR